MADIGGSNARFGWLAPGSRRVEHVDQLPVADYADIASAARCYLDRVRQGRGSDYVAPRHAALAVATAVVHDQVEFTNSDWSFSQHQTREALGLQTLKVINDFEALALSLPHLQPSQLRAHGALPDQCSTLAVIGPGTGLGVASVVPGPSGWIAVPGEGGHATLAAADDYESALLGAVRQRHAHVSAERVLSGIGLPELYRAVCVVQGLTFEPEHDAQTLVAAALTGDAVPKQTLEAFCALLGSFAGSVALTVGARGGAYVGGGIVPRLGEFFFQSRFRERFEDKGRLRPYLQAIPTAVITDTLAALTGAAAALD